MVWGVTGVATGKQWAQEESWDKQKQARNHKNRILAILKGNMHMTFTTYREATRSYLFSNISSSTNFSVFVTSPSCFAKGEYLCVAQGKQLKSGLGEEHAEKH